jgi:hypothetical protein
MSLLGGSLVLYSFNHFASIPKRIDFFPYFPILYQQCLFTNMCVVEREVLLLCSVISAFSSLSKNCLEILDAFRYSDVVWGLHN